MVAAHESDASHLIDYQLRLPAFEGPLDVLLQLIERNRLAITDISLAVVTDQFLAHIDAMRDTPPDLLAEFVAMGARLTVLKSRSLLPQPPAIDEESAPSDLTHQLLRYRQLRDAARGLQAIQLAGTHSFAASRGVSSHSSGSQIIRLATYQASILTRSLRRRLAALPRPTEVLHQRRIVTLQEMVERIIVLPKCAGLLSFKCVLAECRTRSEMATAFLAVLVLVRRDLFDARQEQRFGEITLSLSAKREPVEPVVSSDAAESAMRADLQ